MNKRILAFLIAVVTVISCAVLPASAKDKKAEVTATEISERGQIVSVLGFLDGVNSAANVTFYDYASFLLQAAKLDTTGFTEAETVSAAVNQGYFYSKDAAQAKPGAYITVKEALYGAVNLLGYKGIYTGDNFVTGANRLKLMSGITKNYESTLTGTDFYELAYNILHAKYNNAIGVRTEKTLIYNNGKDVTILSALHGIYEDIGKITANNNTGLYSPDGGTGNGLVKIGDSYYREGKTGAAALIGHEVSYYYKVDKFDEPTLLYAKSEEKEVVTIKSDDIIPTACTDNSVVFYNNNRKKEIMLASDAAVIKNGKAVVDYTKTDFIFETGDITVVGNHTVVIRSFTNHWVKSVDIDTYMMRSYYGTSIDLNPQLNKTIDVEDKNGNPLYVVDIKAYDVISVMESVDKDYVYIIKSTDSVTGTVTKTSVDDAGRTMVTVNGNQYPLSKDYTSSSHSMIIPAKTGLFAKYYLNAFGEVCAISLTNDAKNIGYMIAASSGSMVEPVYIKVYLPDENIIKDIELAERVKVDGGAKIEAAQAYNKFLDTKGEFTESNGIRRQFIGFYLNDEGKIAEIDLPSDGETGESTNSIKRTYNYSDTVGEDSDGDFYRSYSAAIGGKVITSGAKIIQVDSKTAKHNENMYGTMNLSDQTSYRVEAYSLSQNSVASDYICVYPRGGGSSAGEYRFLVNYFYEGLDSEGMRARYVKGIRMYTGMTKNEIMSLEIREGVNFDGVDVGDMIYIGVDGQNRIMEYKMIYDYSEGTINSAVKSGDARHDYESAGSWGAEHRYALFTVKRQQGTAALLHPGPTVDAVGESELLSYSGYGTIPTYDPSISDKDKRMFLGSPSDIISYEDDVAHPSYIFVYTFWGEARFLVNYLR